ncbi:hypothetical protein C8F01DRAFT_1369675 [Mycena amicta]|nr:hypothetical protein C8F01DRAFT_1369675 [Mycena amicta]
MSEQQHPNSRPSSLHPHFDTSSTSPALSHAGIYVVHIAAAKVSRDVLRILAANHVVASGGGDNSNYVEIIELDLQTGIDRLLLVTRIWGKSPVDAFESGVISALTSPRCFKFNATQTPWGLTERHIYVCCHQPYESNIASNKKTLWDSTLRVFAVDVLADFCGPAYPALGSETPRSILLDHLTGIAALNLGPLAVGAISVLASPWPVLCEITTTELVDSDSHLRLDKLQSYEHEELVHLNGNSAYSGHALSGGRPPDLKAYLVMPSSRRYVLTENMDRSWWRMSSYSGAVAYFAPTSNSIVVNDSVHYCKSN